MDEEALYNAMMLAGLGAMGSRGSAWDKLAQAGMFGLQGYNNTLTAREQAKLQKAKLDEEEQQRQQRELAMQKARADLDRQQRMAQIIAGAASPSQPAGSMPSMADAPGWVPQVPQAPKKSVSQMLLEAGFVDEAKKYAEAAKAGQDEVFSDVKRGIDGTPYVLTKYGKPMPLDRAFTPAEKAHFADTGGAIVPLDPYTGKPVGDATAKTMSPEGADASRRGWASVNLEREKFNRGELREGPVPGGTALGWVTPGGFNAVPGTTVKAPDLPGSIIENIAKNDVAISKIDQALEEVKTRPESFGSKNYMGDAVRQRTDPEGVRGRALVADIGSQKLHDRSGAAITAAEAPRLMPFIPTATDSAPTIKTKLENFRNEYAQMNEELKKGRNLAQVISPAAQTQAGRQPSPAEIQAELMRRGIAIGGR